MVLYLKIHNLIQFIFVFAQHLIYLYYLLYKN